jgi:hypothetical protein
MMATIKVFASIQSSKRELLMPESRQKGAGFSYTRALGLFCAKHLLIRNT